MKVPRTLGHEVAGTISAIAPDVTAHLAVGDRVTVETDAYRCGNCEYCLKGEYNRCPYRLGIGTTVDGGLADQLVMPAETVHKLPEGLSMAAGSLSEPLAVSVHAVIEQSPSLAGEVVVVDRARRDRAAVRAGGAGRGRDGRARRPQPARGPARAGPPPRRRPHRRLARPRTSRRSSSR